MSLITRTVPFRQRGQALWGVLAAAVAVVAGRISPVVPTWGWVVGGILGVTGTGVIVAPELALFGLVAIKQIAPQNVTVMELSIAFALIALLGGAWRRLPPVAAIAFGLFLLLSLPSISTTLPPWDDIQPFYVPHTNWITFPIPSYDVLAGLGLVNIAGLACLAAYAVRTRHQLDRFVLALSIAAAYPIGRGVLDRVTGNVLHHDGSPSIASIFGHPNAFAVYLVAVIPLFVAFAVSAPTRNQRLYAAGMSFVGTGCLLLTFSRGGWLSFAFAVVIGAIYAGKLRHVMIAAVATLILAVSIGVAGPVIDRFQGLASTPSSVNLEPGNSWSWRLVTWTRVLQLTPDWQMSGSGYGSYETRTVEVFGLTGGEIGTTLKPGWRHGFGAHNDFVEQYVEGGIPALALWSLFIGGLFAAATRLWFRTREPLTLGAAVSVLGLIVLSFSDNVQVYDWSWFIAAGVVAALWSVFRHGDDTGPDPADDEPANEPAVHAA